MGLKIAFATLYDPRDIRRGSGTYYFMARELEQQGHELVHLGPIKPNIPRLTRAIKRFTQLTSSLSYRSHRDVFMAREIGRCVTRQLQNIQADVIVTNDYAIAGYTRTDYPIILVTDEVFPNPYSENQHPWLENLHPISVWFNQQVVRRGLENAHKIIYPSKWGIKQAQQYGIKDIKQKLNFIRFGANLFDAPPKVVSQNRCFNAIIEKGSIDILYIGNRDWELKGGAVALETVQILRSKQIDATLHIVGVYPEDVSVLPYVRTYGVIDKANDITPLIDLYMYCDVLLVPTLAEGFGVVFVEAAAFGIPSLGYRTIGVSSAIKEGVSGALLEVGSEPESFATVIESWFNNPELYDQLVTSAQRYFEDEANWQVCIKRIVQLMEECRQNAEQQEPN